MQPQSHTIHASTKQPALQHLVVCLQGYDIRSLTLLSSVFYAVLVCVSLTNCNLFQHSLIQFCLHLDIKKKKADNSLIKRQKYESKNISRCPAVWLVYILMPSKKEWVLMQLGSQHDCVERPVQPGVSRPSFLFLHYAHIFIKNSNIILQRKRRVKHVTIERT